ncbi:uncharacterized protein METZ01_LOCUS442980, partial [marine metagenome]
MLKVRFPFATRSVAFFAVPVLAFLSLTMPLSAQVNDDATNADRLQYLDIFEMEVAADPRISPDGSRVVYVRRG